MSAKSAAQQKAAGAALSAKPGETPMSEKQLGAFASSKRKAKPEHVAK